MAVSSPQDTDARPVSPSGLVRAPDIPALSQPDRRRFCTSLLAGTAALALPGMVRAVGSGVRSRTIGTLELTAWSDGTFELPISAFPNATDKEDVFHRGDEVQLGSTAWSIVTPTRSILVDSGSGDALRQYRPGTGRLAERMAASYGAPRADAITDIILTHLHADHIGGLLMDGAPRFPGAVLHISETEWAYWRDPGLISRLPPAQAKMAHLIQGLMDRLAYDIELHPGHADLGEGITLHPAPGHTPGHTIVRLDAGSNQALIAADTLICGPMQLAYPDITYRLDVDVAQAVETRRRLLDMIASDAIPFAATHMMTLTLGQLERDREGYRFQPA